MDNEIKRISLRLKLINEMTEKTANQTLKKYGITLSQMRILMVIDRTEKKTCQMKELEGIFQLSQQNIVGLVKRLEEKKLLETFVDPDDRRMKKVAMTQEGLQVCKKAYKEVEAIDAWIAEGLTEKEKKDFLLLLGKVYQHVGRVNQN